MRKKSFRENTTQAVVIRPKMFLERKNVYFTKTETDIRSPTTHILRS